MLELRQNLVHHLFWTHCRNGTEHMIRTGTDTGILIDSEILICTWTLSENGFGTILLGMGLRMRLEMGLGLKLGLQNIHDKDWHWHWDYYWYKDLN